MIGRNESMEVIFHGYPVFDERYFTLLGHFRAVLLFPHGLRRGPEHERNRRPVAGRNDDKSAPYTGEKSRRIFPVHRRYVGYEQTVFYPQLHRDVLSLHRAVWRGRSDRVFENKKEGNESFETRGCVKVS